MGMSRSHQIEGINHPRNSRSLQDSALLDAAPEFSLMVKEYLQAENLRLERFKKSMQKAHQISQEEAKLKSQEIRQDTQKFVIMLSQKYSQEVKYVRDQQEKLKCQLMEKKQGLQIYKQHLKTTKSIYEGKIKHISKQYERKLNESEQRVRALLNGIEQAKAALRENQILLKERNDTIEKFSQQRDDISIEFIQKFINLKDCNNELENQNELLQNQLDKQKEKNGLILRQKSQLQKENSKQKQTINQLQKMKSSMQKEQTLAQFQFSNKDQHCQELKRELIDKGQRLILAADQIEKLRSLLKMSQDQKSKDRDTFQKKIEKLKCNCKQWQKKQQESRSYKQKYEQLKQKAEKAQKAYYEQLRQSTKYSDKQIEQLEEKIYEERRKNVRIMALIKSIAQQEK